MDKKYKKAAYLCWRNKDLPLLCFPFTGTQSSFRRLYEEPIVRGQQPDATSEEKLLGQTRAAEVIN